MQDSGVSQGDAAAGFFPSRDGTLLHAAWHRARATARAGVVLVHGYAEHGGRYTRVAERLSAAGFSVMAFDYRGHGQAEGARGHCDRFTEFVEDLAAACERAHKTLGLPLTLVAQSHGALVALRALVDADVQLAGVNAAVFTAPFLAPRKVPWWKRAAAQLASRAHPRLALANGLDPARFSHDLKVAERYNADPLNHHVATARWFTEVLAAQEYVEGCAPRLAVPTLWMLAGDDHIVDSQAARRVFERAGPRPEDKQLVVFEGLYHELMNEVDASDVMDTVVTWLLRQNNA